MDIEKSDIEWLINCLLNLANLIIQLKKADTKKPSKKRKSRKHKR